MKRKKENDGGKKNSPKKLKTNGNVMESLNYQSETAIQQVLEKKKKKEKQKEVEPEEDEEEEFKSISDVEEDIFDVIQVDKSEDIVQEEEEMVIDLNSNPEEKKKTKKRNSSAPRRTKLDEFITSTIYKQFLIKRIKKLLKIHQQIENEEIRVIIGNFFFFNF